MREAPERIRKLFRELWLSPFIMGLGVVAGTVAVMAAGGWHPLLGVILGCVLGVPFFLMAFITAVTRSLDAAWVGFAFELFLLLLRLGSGARVLTAVAALVPLMTVYQIRQIRALQALMMAPPVGSKIMR